MQAAIDACTKDQGGTVLVPAGVFVIGSIEIKSHVTLHVSASGKLLGSMDGSQYHASGTPTRGDTTLNDGNWALIYGVEATNVTIEGPGMIDGGGAVPSGLGGNRRPYLLLFYRWKNPTVRTIDLFNCPYHTVRVIQSAYAVLDGIHIHNRVSGNNDGFHFISAEYVNMVNCNVQSGDDACAVWKLQVHYDYQLLVQHALVGVPFRRRSGREHHGLELPADARVRLSDQDLRRSRLAFQEPLVLEPRSGRRDRSHQHQHEIAGRHGCGDRAGSVFGAFATRSACLPRGAVTARNISFSNIHGRLPRLRGSFPIFPVPPDTTTASACRASS